MLDVHLYCDYWASVLGMRGVVSDAAQRRGIINLNVFRSCLDRPETRLPRVGYYLLMLLLGPVMIPYRMIQRVASRLHVPLAGEAEAADLLDPYRLRLEKRDSARVDVSWRGERLVSELIDPQCPEVVFSVVYPAYKILVAALLAIGVSLLLHWGPERESLAEWLQTLLLYGNFLFLAGLLYLIFRDWWTAVLAPLPVFLVFWVVSWIGPVRDMPLGILPATLAGLAVAYFVVDAFMIPRGMAPTLFLYHNDPESPNASYVKGQEPYWLEGEAYWVWRFVSLTPAELHKFWERDWERVEVWVRADGERAGHIEWVVADFHFRELWLPYERLVSGERAAKHAMVLDEVRDNPDGDAAWVIEVDTNFLGHSPDLRGVFMLPLKHGWRRARLRQLAHSLRVQIEADHPRHYRDVIRRLRLSGPDFIVDIPEHLRWYALRQLCSIPWLYWRYPRGANAGERRYLYSCENERDNEPITACEPELQFKAQLHQQKRLGERPATPRRPHERAPSR